MALCNTSRKKGVGVFSRVGELSRDYGSGENLTRI